MASIDQENIPVTPLKGQLSPKGEYSPSNPKRALKPVSPSKYNNNSVGKLNFLQNDNLDNHFDCLHGAHEEMKHLLAVIEEQTKQTNDDLEELFARLKNNNQHLNKLLESIAAYSDEVTTEGNATKSDVSKILERLGDLSPSKIEQLVQISVKASKDDIIKEIKNLLDDSREDPEDSNIEVLLKLNNVERALNKLSDSPSKDIEKVLGSFTSETTNELTKVSELLRHSSDSQRSTIEVITRKLDSIRAVDSNDQTAHLIKLVEQQNETIKSLQLDLRDKKEAQEYEDMQRKHSQLQTKYESLCRYYESKFRDLVNLESKFTELTTTVDALETKIGSIDLQKYDRLQQMHSEKLVQLAKPKYSSSKKRITSMPIKSVDGLHDIHEQNNSDGEF